QRRGFELILGARAELIGLEAPGDLELREVGRVDLRRRRVARAGEVRGVAAPLEIARRLRREHEREQREPDSGQQRFHRSSRVRLQADTTTRTRSAYKRTPHPSANSSTRVSAACAVRSGCSGVIDT